VGELASGGPVAEAERLAAAADAHRVKGCPAEEIEQTPPRGRRPRTRAPGGVG